MPPSLSMNFSCGCFCRTPEKSRSDTDHMRLVAYREMATAKGASRGPACGPSRPDEEKEKPGTKLPEPKCNEIGVSVSTQACQRGSQAGEWNEGRPSGAGLSGKETVRTPLAAVRRTSSAHSCGSQMGRIAS